MVGIVGRNGAGKSSLLKIVSGVLEPPTSGKMHFDGRIAPILELGTGFDHELTGRENIFLNGLLLGRTRREIRERLDAIVEYSELGDFIESPIRSYSSGMLGRLGFSIAAAWTPDLLILDEVFAAGDAAFTRKCEKTLSDFRDAGVTILLVSHSAQIVLETCSRALWLDRGHLRRRRQAERGRHRLRPEHLRHRLTATARAETQGQAPVFCGKLVPVPVYLFNRVRSAPPSS